MRAIKHATIGRALRPRPQICHTGDVGSLTSMFRHSRRAMPDRGLRRPPSSPPGLICRGPSASTIGKPAVLRAIARTHPLALIHGRRPLPDHMGQLPGARSSITARPSAGPPRKGLIDPKGNDPDRHSRPPRTYPLRTGSISRKADCECLLRGVSTSGGAPAEDRAEAARSWATARLNLTIRTSTASETRSTHPARGTPEIGGDDDLPGADVAQGSPR